MSCKSCRSKDFFTDDTSGMQVCSACGVVQDLNNFEHQFGGISGPQGSFIRLGTVGVGTEYSYRERKLFQSDTIIKEITYRLDFSDARTTEVKDMVNKVTANEFGLGNWFYVLVGACSCIVMRMDNKPLPMSDVADAVGCDLYEMGRMINRVVEFLGIQLPEFDIVGMLEKLIRKFHRFQAVGVDNLELMTQQGRFILQCTIKWFVTTGRRPGPVTVAVLVFVAKLNGIQVKIEEAAKEADAAVHTCKKRYNELLELLVKVAQKLPWGKDVNVKNILKNAPFVFKYMEMKSKEKEGAKRKRIGNEDTRSSSLDMEELLGECLGGALEYGSMSMSELESTRVSHEALAQIYSKFSLGASMAKLTERGEPSYVAEGGQSWCNEYDFCMYNEWWGGRLELCKRLMTEEITEIDVGLDVLPPSYLRGRQEVKRRKQKIKAAKTRISSIACPQNSKAVVCVSDANSEDANGACISEDGDGRRKRRKTKESDIDWEDFIIETLLLHQVREDEIEKGHYNTLLDLHVFSSGVL